MQLQHKIYEKTELFQNNRGYNDLHFVLNVMTEQ